MGALATVTKLNVNNVYTQIITFLDEYESEKTKVDYLRNIKDFFMYFHGKEIEQLAKEDIEYIRTEQALTKLMNMHVIQYKNHLTKTYSNSSVMQRLSSVRALYGFFKRNGYDVDPEIFKVKTLHDTSKSYGIFTPDEVKKLVELAKNMINKKGYELSCFFNVAAVTSIRLSALLSLKWSDIYKHESDNIYIVKTIDKGQAKAEMPIEEWLYNDLLKIGELHDNELIFFRLKKGWVQTSLHKLTEQMGLPKERNLQFHSLRKVATDWEMKTTGDMKKAMKQSRHKNAATLYNHYVDKNVDYANMSGITMMKKINEEVFDLVSKKELLDMLKETNYGAYQQLALKLQRMVE